jgi:hypothetical protein
VRSGGNCVKKQSASPEGGSKRRKSCKAKKRKKALMKREQLTNDKKNGNCEGKGTLRMNEFCQINSF